MSEIFIIEYQQPDGTFTVLKKQIRTDGKVLSSYFYNVFLPGEFDRLTEFPIHIQEKAKLIWTSEIIDIWKENN